MLPHLLDLQKKIEAKGETDEREFTYIVSGNTLKVRKEKPSRACRSPEAKDVKFRSELCVIPHQPIHHAYATLGVWRMVAQPAWLRAQARSLCRQIFLSGVAPLS